MVDYEYEPEKGGGAQALTVIGGILLVLSFLFVAFVTIKGVEFATKETCGPNPPSGQRYTMVALTAIFYFVCAIPAVYFLNKKSTEAALVGLLLSIGALCEPLVGTLVMAFTVAMC